MTSPRAGSSFMCARVTLSSHTDTHLLPGTHRLGLDTWELNLVNSPGAVHSEPVWRATGKGRGLTLSLGHQPYPVPLPVKLKGTGDPGHRRPVKTEGVWMEGWVGIPCPQRPSAGHLLGSRLGSARTQSCHPKPQRTGRRLGHETGLRAGWGARDSPPMPPPPHHLSPGG